MFKYIYIYIKSRIWIIFTVVLRFVCYDINVLGCKLGSLSFVQKYSRNVICTEGYA